MSRAQPASDYIGQNTRIRSGTNSEAEVTIASATTTDIGNAGANRVAVSLSASPITSLGTAANKVILVRFTGIIVLTNNANIILPGGANITTAVGDTAVFSSDNAGTTWRCVSYTRASGAPLSGGVNTAQLCKAWVNFNGTGTVAIRDQYNVSSITDNGVGDYTVNFTSAMTTGNYWMGGSGRASYLTVPVVNSTVLPTTSSIRIFTGSYNTLNVDQDYTSVAIFSN